MDNEEVEVTRLPGDDSQTSGSPSRSLAGSPLLRRRVRRILLFACTLLLAVLALFAAVRSSRDLAVLPSPTSSPRPTATPVPPQTLKGATLGGTKAGFQDKYGQATPFAGKDAVAYRSASFINVAFVLWEYKTGTDHAAHLSTVQVVLAAGEYWEAVNEQTICGFLRPDDAQHVSETTLTTPSGATIDEFLYQSAELAATFPAADFTDHAGTHVTAGMFAIDYLPDPLSSADPYGGTGHCELSLGKY